MKRERCFLPVIVLTWQAGRLNKGHKRAQKPKRESQLDFYSVQLSATQKGVSKFYEVSKLLDKRTDAHNRAQYLVCWRGYVRKDDSWVDAEGTNEYVRQVFRT